MEKKIYEGYVKIGKGYYVQKPDENQWGFTIYSDDQSWDGGFGIADNQEIRPVPANKVPKKVKAELEWILNE